MNSRRCRSTCSRRSDTINWSTPIASGSPLDVRTNANSAAFGEPLAFVGVERADHQRPHEPADRHPTHSRKQRSAAIPTACEPWPEINSARGEWLAGEFETMRRAGGQIDGRGTPPRDEDPARRIFPPPFAAA